jgi:1-aminocyclopropane-1-carboxylate deaminase/D-cysteine desulfhydrase-like pyridoxal-dependent ACC family enzyme
MRHLSGLDKGIQSWHAGQHYANKYWNEKEFQQWAKHDETITILSAGSDELLLKAVKRLQKIGVKVVVFREPDFCNAPTAAFVVDDRVSPKYGDVDDAHILAIRNILKNYPLASN